MADAYLQFKRADCKHCYRCIRECPVKAIGFTEQQARILEDECVLCGQCVVACPQNAKEVRRDVEAARALLESGAPVYVSLAPSFTANYPDIDFKGMAAALSRLGFAGVEETALGATVVTGRYEELAAEDGREVILSSCCHSITLLVQRHFPDLLPCLAPVVSPMQAHCRDLKRRFPGAKTVFIGPCFSKKAEADAFPGDADCVLTFEELSQWLREAGTSPAPVSPGDVAFPTGNGEGRARLYPVDGGILRSMRCDAPGRQYLSVDGMAACIHALENIRAGGLGRCFIEMSACAHSCVGGPAMERERRARLSGMAAVNRCAGQRHFSVPMPENALLERRFPHEDRPHLVVSDEALKDVLRKTGKTLPEHELNCGSCGYSTCREKARAVLLGKAELSMCLPFLKEKAESFSDAIITHTPNGVLVLSENLVVQQINRAACRIFNLDDPADAVGGQVVRLMDADVLVEALESGGDIFERPAFLADCGRHVRQTVVRDRTSHMLILLVRDVTEEENARRLNLEAGRRTAETADHVIAKHMRVVQEIASLLGETTAETKVALTQLKESLHLDE